MERVTAPITLKHVGHHGTKSWIETDLHWPGIRPWSPTWWARILPLNQQCTCHLTLYSADYFQWGVWPFPRITSLQSSFTTDAAPSVNESSQVEKNSTFLMYHHYKITFFNYWQQTHDAKCTPPVPFGAERQSEKRVTSSHSTKELTLVVFSPAIAPVRAAWQHSCEYGPDSCRGIAKKLLTRMRV